jgi:hypothetical protein
VTPSSPGPLLVALGVGLVLVGLLVWSGALSWFGRLPGDIRSSDPYVIPRVDAARRASLLYLIRRLF